MARNVRRVVVAGSMFGTLTAVSPYAIADAPIKISAPNARAVAGVQEALDTFDARSRLAAQQLACDPTSSNEVKTKPLTNNEAWVGYAQAMLEFDGVCPSVATGVTLADRQKLVNDGLIAFDASHQTMGTDISYVIQWIDIGGALVVNFANVLALPGAHSTFGVFFGTPIILHRGGELDSAVKGLIPMLFQQLPKGSAAYTNVVRQLAFTANLVGPPTSIDLDFRGESPPVEVAACYALQYIADAGLVPAVFVPLCLPINLEVRIPETENHAWNYWASQYLLNQIVLEDFPNGDPSNPRSPSYFDNRQNGMREFILGKLRGILQTDFYEYNSHPYERYTLHSLQNLAEFANDADVATAARMALDWAYSKYASSSSLLRRSGPFRRKGENDSTFLGDDELYCAFSMIAGQTQATQIDADHQFIIPPCVTTIARQSIHGTEVRGPGTVHRYHVPPLVLDMAMFKDASYIQTFSGGSSNYYTANAVGGAEIYDNEGPFVIAAGGEPIPSAFNVDVSVEPLGWTAATLHFGTSNTNENTGVSVPTVLMLNDALLASQISTIIDPFDRKQAVRIAGTLDSNGHGNSNNLCVTNGFACGNNPQMPDSLYDANGGIQRSCPTDGTRAFPCLVSSGFWTFADLGSTFVAMAKTPFSSPSCGFFAAEDAANYQSANPAVSSFTLFVNKVKRFNSNAGVVLSSTSGSPDCRGIYHRSIDEIVNYDTSRATYPIINTGLGTDPSAWDLAGGPVSSSGHSGAVFVRNPHYGSQCILDYHDLGLGPGRTHCEDDTDGDGWLDTQDNCPYAYNPGQENCNVKIEAASIERDGSSGKGRLLGDVCDPVPCATPGFAVDLPAPPVCTGATCCREMVRDRIFPKSVGSHSYSSRLAQFDTDSSQIIRGLKTEARFCQRNAALGFYCSGTSFINDSFLMDDDQPFPDPLQPWNRVSISDTTTSTVGGCPLPGQQLSFDYGDDTHNSGKYLWAYKCDAQRWFSNSDPNGGVLPPPETRDPRCVFLGPGSSQGACISGVFWLSGLTDIGTTQETVMDSGGNPVLVGKHNFLLTDGSLADGYVDAQPERSYCYSTYSQFEPTGPGNGGGGGGGIKPGVVPLTNTPPPGGRVPPPTPRPPVASTSNVLEDPIDQVVGIAATQPAPTIGYIQPDGTLLIPADGPIAGGTLVASFADQSLVWASAVEPNDRIGPLSGAVVAVALSSDGTTIMNTAVNANGELVSGCEVADSGICISKGNAPAGAPAPTPRHDFASVFSRSATGVFVIGGTTEGPKGTAQSDVWFHSLKSPGGWAPVPFKGVTLGHVLAATYAYRGGDLWIVDRVDAKTRLLRMNPFSGTVTIFASWRSSPLSSKWFMSIDRDGGVLVTATSAVPAVSVTARIALDRPKAAITSLHVERGEVVRPIVVDDNVYSFVIRAPHQALRIQRHATLIDKRRDAEGLEKLEAFAELERDRCHDDDD